MPRGHIEYAVIKVREDAVPPLRKEIAGISLS